MDQQTRNLLQRATQDARRLLETEFADQLEGIYDILPDGRILDKAGPHLDDRGRLIRQKLVEAIRHRMAAGKEAAEAVSDYRREAAFTFLNRFAALKMLEARGLVLQCISKGEQSSGFREFAGLAPGLLDLPDHGYRLYLECLFDELSTEVKVLFDRYDVASLLWPRRQALNDLLGILNQTDLAGIWPEDETIGWVYQYFNSQEERREMRDKHAAPQNSHELAVRNQFFTPRYVVEFLTDNTLGRIWYEMHRGQTQLADRCRYLVRRPKEIFLGDPALARMRALGENQEEGHMPETVSAAFHGDFKRALSEKIGGYRWWISLAVPPDQYEKVTGIPLDALGDYPHIHRVWDALDNRPDETILRDPLQILVALSQFVLTSSGGPHSVKPLERLWEALRKAVEGVKEEDLSQEDLLNQPVFVPHRPKKDPRDLKVLDPASGSGHFLLYAFDLMLTIYEEAWADKDSPPSEVTGKALRENYPVVEDLRKAVPGLILGHNLHGIDIDPRCAQIAALALWMRAQRAYNDFGIPRDVRPAIKKTNIVVAEPMPGEKDLLKEFAGTLSPPLLAQFVEAIFDKMKLAGEAGSLLKIEEEIRDAISKAREQWVKGPEQVQLGLFGEQKPRQRRLDFSGITDDDFWQQAERRIYEALHEFATRASNGKVLGRRLFADDAERGFAFADLCRQQYDVLVMNPPYGKPTGRSAAYVKEVYSDCWIDLFGAFLLRALCLCTTAGRIGSLTSRTFLALPRFRALRERLAFSENSIESLADFGFGVLDGAMVETCACVTSRMAPAAAVTNAIVLRDIDEPNRGSTLLRVLSADISPRLFRVRRCDLAQLPGRQIAYWVSRNLLNAFSQHPHLEPEVAEVAPGLTTLENSRFLRSWWECPAGYDAWVPFAKGGAFSKFFYDSDLMLLWARDGLELREFIKMKYGGSESRFIANARFYFRRGLTYPRSTVKGFNVRVLPDGHIFGEKGICIFPNDNRNLFNLLGFMNSRFAAYCLEAQTSSRQWEKGMVASLPIASSVLESKVLRELSVQALNNRRLVKGLNETTHLFVLPFLEKGLEESRKAVLALEREFDVICRRIDAEVLGSYGLDEDDLARADDSGASGETIESGDEPEETEQETTLADDARRLVSYAFGCAIGRWDVRYAIGNPDRPRLPEPFDALPKYALGMLVGENDLPAEQPPSGYPPSIRPVGVLVDDFGHPDDIVDRMHAVLNLVWPNMADNLCRQIVQTIEGQGDSLRPWLGRHFFDDHVKRYSKSRRKAPIYWQLATPSASYSVWLYYHRFTKDSFYKVLNDYVTPKVRHEESRLQRMASEFGLGPSASQRRELETRETFVAELRAFREEIERIAPLWNPDLNDGVIINFAPLWRLVPQHRAWQKECKECWDKLVAGDYDWARLAMHLWPERVVPNCATDVSLAIAHGLEDVFWEQDEDEKRQKKAVSKEQVQALIAERTKPAVKAALKSLLDAPAPGGAAGGRRGRRPRR